jgi:heat shock protein 1/8
MPPNNDNGVWIGIDLGTSNSACAVWDSTRGSPKWMRLAKIAVPESSGKMGRMVSSVVKLKEGSSSSRPLVGAEALNDASSAGLIISSVKRLLGRNLADLDSHWRKSLPFEVDQDEDHNLVLLVTNENGQTMRATPVEILSMILKAMREASQQYLDKYARKKHLDIPGTGQVRNAVVGVPAHFSKRHIALVEEACRLAGFDGTIHTCLESTAAAMAYGLTLQETSDEANIMVIDMGGGTTDITIASKTKKRNDSENHASSYKVLVTQGDEKLGGDDIDQAIVDFCLDQLPSTREEPQNKMELLQACRKVKEALCDAETPNASETISIEKEQVVIGQDRFEKILEPWLERVSVLVRTALEQFQQRRRDEDAQMPPSISEVILVGGTTRVPAIRRMIQTFFPKLELCISLNPMSSVAQGLAIQAALLSKLVPLHQLQSALMLDCIPHTIGVQLEQTNGHSHFIEILPRNTPLPARGSATFCLADKYQPGVTIRAVEQVGEETFEPMAKEDFTFLLRRLSPEEYAQLSVRSIEVGMKVDTQGQFIVSIYDQEDPEQVRKRERYKRQQQQAEGHAEEAAVGELGYIADLVLSESGTTMEQFLLLGTLIGVVVLYIAVKLVFNEPGQDGSGATIL